MIENSPGHACRQVDREFAETRALAATFGFPATPGLIVGRTMVVGAIGPAELRACRARARRRSIEACR
jgi:hypothetical protein